MSTSSYESKGVRVVNVYYPESCAGQDLRWLDDLEAAAQWVAAGDFNAHHSWWGGPTARLNTAGRQLAESIVSSDLCLLNDGSHTRVPDRADHGMSAIDLTLISPALYGDAEWETSSELWGSDHLPISLVLRGVQPQEDSGAETRFDYSNADWDNFRLRLASAVYPAPTDDTEACHANIRGNDLADSAAKSAAALPEILEDPEA
nr:hypothetical protein BaRGS_019222 [Batillaria attramentaria]